MGNINMLTYLLVGLKEVMSIDCIKIKPYG